MNRADLKARLTEAGVSEAAYELSGEPANEKYVLEKTGPRWSVYYSERGERANEKLFDTEHEACRTFLSLVLKDPTTKRRRAP